MKNILERIKKFSRKEWIYISIWSLLNLIFFFVLLIPAQAGFLNALIYFIFWELVLFTYYLIRVRKGEKDTKGREWIDAIAFAVITATLIKTFLVDAFTIPTPSMEKSMMVGDFLFVSKWDYGTRIPNTPVSFPFVHNTMPFGSGDSYSESMSLPYWRFPGTNSIKNNDIVVFNYPGQDPMNNEARPVDKRENYIKRCVGIAGDSLKIIGGQVYINGQALAFPENSSPQHGWIAVYAAGPNPNDKKVKERLKEKYDINPDAIMFYGNNTFQIGIPDEFVDEFKASEPLANLTSIKDLTTNSNMNSDDRKFPDHYLPDSLQFYRWTNYDFGPVYLPKAGETLPINESNYLIYHRCITLYEGNTAELRGTQVFINGAPVTSYTFKYNYYFMMGDNRDNSSDSRVWGFVPENHVVGKAWFVWMSWDKFGDGFFDKVRWDRLFRGVH